MSIESLRNEIRGIEQEILILKQLEMTQEILKELHVCYERKWEIEAQIKLAA